jgi:hypothetical protein
VSDIISVFTFSSSLSLFFSLFSCSVPLVSVMVTKGQTLVLQRYPQKSATTQVLCVVMVGQALSVIFALPWMFVLI